LQLFSLAIFINVSKFDTSWLQVDSSIRALRTVEKLSFFMALNIFTILHLPGEPSLVLSFPVIGLPVIGFKILFTLKLNGKINVKPTFQPESNFKPQSVLNSCSKPRQSPHKAEFPSLELTISRQRKKSQQP